jgi:glycosyltransferase involved in cell wall biosynthesis
MHVALLNPVFWPEVRRGSERFARELADGLLARGHRVSLVTSTADRRAAGTAVEDGLEVVRVHRPGGDRIEQRLQRRLFEPHLAHLPAAYRALRRLDPDVAHALYPTDALAALRWKARTGRPVVFSYMGIPHRVSLANRRRRKEIVTRACAESDAVVALGETARAGFERWLGVEARVIAPAVDLDAFTPGTPADRAPTPEILCAADHTQPRKRVALLAEAVARIDGARLVVTRVPGHPPPAGATEIDLDDRAALAAANRRAWTHALPSVGEAFGLVLAEALACGTPVVGGEAEVVGGPETGRLFTGEDPDELAAALRATLALADDPATIARCRARAERWSVAACATAYEALYAEVGAGA